MDPLISLPTNPSFSQGQDEEYVMKKYFFTNTTEQNLSWLSSVKIAAIATVAALLLYNPLTQKALSYVPYLNKEGVIGTMIRALLLFVLVVVAVKFLV